MKFLIINLLLLPLISIAGFYYPVAANVIRLVTIAFLNFSLCVIIFLNSVYNKSLFWYQYLLTFYKLSFSNMDLTWGFDISSLNLILLSIFLLVFCLSTYWNLKYKASYYFFLITSTLWILINVFSVSDFSHFPVSPEFIVVPMYFLIGIWGSRNRKISASYQLFLHTILGSIFIAISISDLILNKGNLSIIYYLNSLFNDKREFIIWFSPPPGFSVKSPLVPLHQWLPEAHVEAPTPGSVILAGILLKLGSYAILRFLSGNFTFTLHDLIFFILIISLFSLTYSSIVALCQIDIKKIIAYSSIAHMNYSLIGSFTQNILGFAGAYIMIFSHAITSSALFLGIGVLYERHKTRLIFYYGSLATFMPIFAVIFFIHILPNFGFPGTFNFVGEFLLTLGAFIYTPTIAIISTFSLILSLIYSSYLYNKIFFGHLNVIFISHYTDITRLEFFILLNCFLIILIYGFYPQSIFNNLYYFIYKLNFFIIK